MHPLRPQVKWAQRKECIILTIDTAPCPKSYTFEVNSNSVIFRFVMNMHHIFDFSFLAIPRINRHLRISTGIFNFWLSRATPPSGEVFYLHLQLYSQIRTQVTFNTYYNLKKENSPTTFHLKVKNCVYHRICFKFIIIVHSQYKKLVTDSKLQLCLTRREAKYWPRLLATKDKVRNKELNQDLVKLRCEQLLYNSITFKYVDPALVWLIKSPPGPRDPLKYLGHPRSGAVY